MKKLLAIMVVLVVALASLSIAVAEDTLTYGYIAYQLRVVRGEASGFGNLLDGFAITGRAIALTLLIVATVAGFAVGRLVGSWAVATGSTLVTLVVLAVACSSPGIGEPR